jgi:hypothetical protein
VKQKTIKKLTVRGEFSGFRSYRFLTLTVLDSKHRQRTQKIQYKNMMLQKQKDLHNVSDSLIQVGEHWSKPQIVGFFSFVRSSLFISLTIFLHFVNSVGSVSRVVDVSLTSFTPKEAITLTGADSSRAGYSVDIGGDFNNDSISDFAVAAVGYSGYTGRVYLVYGSESLSDAMLEDLPPSRGVKITGNAMGDNLGIYVSIGGDVNGDGIADVLIGADGYSTRTGRAYLIYGSSSLYDINLGSFSSSQGITITGVHTDYHTGGCVFIGGDVNADNYDDFIITADKYGDSTGIAYLIFGGPNLVDIDLTVADVSRFITITGEPQSGLSYAAIGGDVNGDGKADILLGAPFYSSNTGRVYLIYGKQTMGNIDLSSLGSAGIVITGEAPSSFTGSAISIGGDVNGDKRSDILIGAYPYSSYTGRAYLIYGGDNLIGMSNINLQSITPSLGIKITGENPNDCLGVRLSLRGDVNGDGYADLLIGAYQYGSFVGRAYLIYGSHSLGNIALSSLSSNQGIKISGGVPGDTAGYSVAIGGDVNNDNKTDILISALGYSSSTGRNYLIYGRRHFEQNLNLGSDYPTSQPTSKPSAQPSTQPTRQPSSIPSRQPVAFPSAQPSQQPSRQPVVSPTSQPSCQPTCQPTIKRSFRPTFQPTTAAAPTIVPFPSSLSSSSSSSAIPTVVPSHSSSSSFSSIPTMATPLDSDLSSNNHSKNNQTTVAAISASVGAVGGLLILLFGILYFRNNYLKVNEETNKNSNKLGNVEAGEKEGADGNNYLVKRSGGEGLFHKFKNDYKIFSVSNTKVQPVLLPSVVSKLIFPCPVGINDFQWNGIELDPLTTDVGSILLGRGTFARVFKARLKTSKQIIAIKTVTNLACELKGMDYEVITVFYSIISVCRY